MSQNAKEQLLKTSLADNSKLRCRQEFDLWWETLNEYRESSENDHLVAWLAWRSAWRFLQGEYEAYVRS